MSLKYFKILIIVLIAFGCSAKAEKKFFSDLKKNNFDGSYIGGSFFSRVISGERFVYKLKLVRYPNDILEIVQKKVRNDIDSDQYWDFLLSMHDSFDLRIEASIDQALEKIIKNKSNILYLHENPGTIMDIVELFHLKSQILINKNKGFNEYFNYLESFDTEFAFLFGLPILGQFVFENKVQAREIDDIFQRFDVIKKRYPTDDIKFVV